MNTDTSTKQIQYRSEDGIIYKHTFDIQSNHVYSCNNMYHLRCSCHLVLFSWIEGEGSCLKAMRRFCEYHRIDM